jgi:AraC-like DNA-binding protein
MHREYARLFGNVVQFGSEATELEFPCAWLDRTHGYPNSDLNDLLAGRAERMLGRLESDAALSQRVAQLLAAHDTRHMPALEAVARELRMSVRSLRRKLAAEHASYSKLLGSARASTAKRLLQDPRTSIQEAAFALGFATPSAFHHAFKRWTRLTPQQYRASL